MARKYTFYVPHSSPPEYLTSAEETIDYSKRLLGIPELWIHGKGEGMKVAILDSGIAINHMDIKGSVVEAKDFTGSSSGTADVEGHGTHVAGIVAARMNSRGVVGVAPLCQLYVGKVLNDSGRGTNAGVAAGIRWAVKKKVDIIGLSLGSTSPSRAMRDSIKEADRQGIFVIAAAGNTGPDLGTVNFPAKYPEVIAVGAVDRRMKITQFSSRGETVDIVAPGDKILSCYPPNAFARLSGTSQATPLVIGVGLLMLQKHREHGGKSPVETVKDFREHLRRSAIDLGPEGIDPHYGAGLLNPAKLLERKAPIPIPTSNTTEVPDVGLRLVYSDLGSRGKRKVKDYISDEKEGTRISIPIQLWVNT